MNPWEERNRERKASALLIECIRQGVTASEAARLHPKAWLALADCAGCEPPSYLTLTIVIENLRNREESTRAA